MLNILKKIIFACIYALLLSLSGCKSDIQKEIIRFEFENNKITVVKIDSIKSFTEFTAQDSIFILKQNYDSLYRKKLYDLNNQLQKLTNEVNDAQKELTTITNDRMYKIYKNAVDGLIQKKQRIEKIIFIYKNDIKQTEFNKLSVKIDNLSIYPDSVVGYLLLVVFTGKENYLPIETYKRIYLFDISKNKIRGVVRNSAYYTKKSVVTSINVE